MTIREIISTLLFVILMPIIVPLFVMWTLTPFLLHANKHAFKDWYRAVIKLQEESKYK